MRVTQKEKDEAIARLREILRPGDKVFGIVRTVSRSGMSRTIDFYVFKAAGPDEPGRKHCGEVDRFYLSGYIATALGYNRDKSGALKVQGCGQDMIFATIYNLAMVIYRDLTGLTPGQAGIPPEMLRRNGEIPEHIDIGDIGYLLKSDQL